VSFGRGLGIIAMSLCILVMLDTCATPSPVTQVRAVSVEKVNLGISFSERRAEYYGLDYQVAYRELLSKHFSVIRLSTYWKYDLASNFRELDWMMRESAAANQDVILSVGMKGLGWPEFYFPDYLLDQSFGSGADLGSKQKLDDATLEFIRGVVIRYKDNPSLLAWQVENEPLNHAGDSCWLIDPQFLAKEVGVVKGADTRKVVVNAFTHFNMSVDWVSNNGCGAASIISFIQGGAVEDKALSVLGSGDTLGLDVYTVLADKNQGINRADSDWASHAGDIQASADRQEKRAWATEVQAEPWINSLKEGDNNPNLLPKDLVKEVQQLKAQGFSYLLLWGAEYWLRQRDLGNSSWLETVQVIQDQVNQPDFGR